MVKPTDFKRLFIAVFVLLLLVSGIWWLNSGFRRPLPLANKTIDVPVNEEERYRTWEEGYYARLLSRNLKYHPFAANFRMYWAMNMGSGGGSEMTIKYDRRNKTLEVDSHDRGRAENYVIGNITDQVIHQAAQDGALIDYWPSMTNALTRYGCRLIKRQVTPPAK